MKSSIGGERILDRKKLKERAELLKKDIPAVLFALKHPKTPLKAKIIAAVAVAYALSPIDLIPDFIPVLGYIDDIIVLPALITISIKLIPADVFEECRKKAEANDSSAKLYSSILYSLPVIAIWLIILYLIIHQIIK